jgi:hypothetical protein
VLAVTALRRRPPTPTALTPANQDRKLACGVTFTKSGRTASMLAHQHPGATATQSVAWVSAHRIHTKSVHMETPRSARPDRRHSWIPLLMGVSIGSGLHTLFIVLVGMSPQPDDNLNLWSTYFVYVSAVPVLVTVAIGLILASRRSRLALLGIGLVAGAIASPLLWLVHGSTQYSSLGL